MTASVIPADRDEFGRWCEAEGIHTVVAGAGDTHGIWRGKRLPVADFLDRLGRGIPFSDVILVLTHSEDSDEGQEFVEPPGGAAYPLYFPRKEHGFPDIFAVPDLSTAFQQAALEYVNDRSTLEDLLAGLQKTQRGAGSSPGAKLACAQP